MVILHSGKGEENVDIFTKLPIFLSDLGILWAMLLILFTQMTTAFKNDFD